MSYTETKIEGGNTMKLRVIVKSNNNDAPEIEEAYLKIQ